RGLADLDRQDLASEVRARTLEACAIGTASEEEHRDVFEERDVALRLPGASPELDGLPAELLRDLRPVLCFALAMLGEHPRQHEANALSVPDDVPALGGVRHTREARHGRRDDDRRARPLDGLRERE